MLDFWRVLDDDRFGFASVFLPPPQSRSVYHASGRDGIGDNIALVDQAVCRVVGNRVGLDRGRVGNGHSVGRSHQLSQLRVGVQLDGELFSAFECAVFQQLHRQATGTAGDRDRASQRPAVDVVGGDVAGYLVVQGVVGGGGHREGYGVAFVGGGGVGIDAVACAGPC